MANGKSMEECKSYPMNGGDGPYSYSQNSFYQREAMDAAKSMIIEAIFEHFDIQNSPFGCSNIIKIADFGCSVGSNTFMAMQNIIEAIQLKHKSTINQNPNFQNHPQTLEFQVFFNDLVNNDFNTLFLTLPNPRSYFPAGVPGSFHHRLFPEASLQVAHSSHALHWLAKIPEELLDRNSPTWNKGRVHYNGNARVLEAYSGEFKRNMGAFLNARAQEVVGGGLILILVQGCEDGVLPSDTLVSTHFGLFGSCLMDMVKMGKISEEQVDSFNLPMYHTSPMELRELIEKNGHFHIKRMENFNPYVLDIELPPDFHMLATSLRAVIEGLITGHFGSEIIDELFDRFVKKMAENTPVFHPQNLKEFIIFACLKRKIN